MKEYKDTGYFVTRAGVVIGKRGKILSQFLDRRGKPCVEIFYGNGMSRQTRVAEMVYELYGTGEKPKKRWRRAVTSKLSEIKRLDSSDEYGTDERFNLEAKSSHDLSK